MIIDGGVYVDTVRMARIVDPHTGDIILRGAGASRLSQAMAAGLVADTIRDDVEAVSRENSGLKAALGAAGETVAASVRKGVRALKNALNGSGAGNEKAGDDAATSNSRQANNSKASIAHSGANVKGVRA